MMPIRTDDSRWPLLVFHYPEQYSSEDVTVHVTELTNLLMRGQRCAAIFHLTGARAFNATERALFAGFVKEHAELVSRFVAAASLVTDSPLHLGVLTAVSWFVPMPCEVKVHLRLPDALGWARGRLQAQADAEGGGQRSGST